MFTIFEMFLAVFAPGSAEILVKVGKVTAVILRLMGIELPTA